MLFDNFYYSYDLNPVLWKRGMVFEEDPNKGDSDKKGGGGGGGDDKKPPESKTYTIKVNGVDKIITEQEALELATKTAGADEKFRKAAEMVKEAETLKEEAAQAKKITTTFNKLFKSDSYTRDDIREFGSLVGMTAEQMEEIFSEEIKKADKRYPEDKGTPMKKIKMEDLDPELQENLNQSRVDQIERSQKKIASMCNLAVDKDEFFGKILDRTENDIKDGRKEAIVEMVTSEVNRKILASPYTNEPFGDQMIKSAVQEVRAKIKKFGIPDKMSKQPVGSLLAGLGLSGELTTKIQADEPIERVPVDHPQYIENFMARLAQKQGIK